MFRVQFFGELVGAGFVGGDVVDADTVVFGSQAASYGGTDAARGTGDYCNTFVGHGCGADWVEGEAAGGLRGGWRGGSNKKRWEESQ